MTDLPDLNLPEMVPVYVEVISGYTCPLCGEPCRGARTSWAMRNRRFSPCGCVAREGES